MAPKKKPRPGPSSKKLNPLFIGDESGDESETEHRSGDEEAEAAAAIKEKKLEGIIPARVKNKSLWKHFKAVYEDPDGKMEKQEWVNKHAYGICGHCKDHLSANQRSTTSMVKHLKGDAEVIGQILISLFEHNN